MDARERESIELGLASADEELRRLAVESLGGLPMEEALPRLVTCLGDSSWRVRKAAVDRLVNAPDAWLAARSLIEALADGENPGRRNSAVEALVRCGARVVPALLEASASADVDVRAAAADALGATGGSEAMRALLACAVRPSEERLVRFSALRALARREAPLCARDLGPAIDDPWLKPVAFGVLGVGASDDGEAVEHLLKGLAAGSRSVREAAMAALLRRL